MTKIDCQTRPRLSCALLILSACMLLNCGEIEGPDEDPLEGESSTDQEQWECTGERDGWERCDGDSVIWCHGVAHGEYGGAHFHEGTNCAERSASCVELTEQEAACRDDSSTCSGEDARCQDRYAQNCVEGAWAQKRCSLAEECALDQGLATCIPKSSGGETQ